MIFKVVLFLVIYLAVYLYPFTILNHISPPIKIDFEKSSDIDSFVSRQNLTLYYQKWGNKKDPKAVILGVHGLGEGSYRYDFVGNSFSKNDYLFVMINQQGHGISEGDRCHIVKYQDLVQDMNDFIDDFFEKNPKLLSKPRYIFGHSMGGLITTLTVLKRHEFFNGMILSGPLFKADPKIANPVLIMIVKYLSVILPKLPVGDAINPTDVSRSKEIQYAYETDALTYHGKLRANLGYQMLLGIQEVEESFSKINLPFLLMHGKQDKLVMLSGSEKMYQESSSKDKEIKIYQNLYHEILNEPEKEEVMNDILKWLSQRVK